jgi:hypothetical protein
MKHQLSACTILLYNAISDTNSLLGLRLSDILNITAHQTNI